MTGLGAAQIGNLAFNIKLAEGFFQKSFNIVIELRNGKNLFHLPTTTRYRLARQDSIIRQRRYPGSRTPRLVAIDKRRHIVQVNDRLYHNVPGEFHYV
jgi:hypothetical protein